MEAIMIPNVENISDMQTIGNFNPHYFEEDDHLFKKARARRQARKDAEQAEYKKQGLVQVVPNTGKKKRKTKIGKFLQKIGTGIKKAVTAPGLAILLPFKDAMKQGLIDIGVAPSSEFRTLVDQFYNFVVRKQPKIVGTNFDNGFEELHFSDARDEDHAVGIATAIIDGVISFFKTLRQRQEAGEQLSEREQKLVRSYDQVETQLEASARAEAAEQVGSKILFDGKTQIIIVVAIVGIIALVLWLRR